MLDSLLQVDSSIGGKNGINPSSGGDGGSGYVAIAYPIGGSYQ